MNFKLADITQILILIITASIMIGKYIMDISNIKKEHKKDMKVIEDKQKQFNIRVCKAEKKVDGLELLVIDMKWLKEAMTEMKLDIKELKNK